MTTNESLGGLSWAGAVRRVLEEAGEPLHYTEVGARVAEQGFTRSVGVNPAAGANATLRSLLKVGDVTQTARGFYALAEVAGRLTKEEVEAEEEEASKEADSLTINAYGLYWSRSSVDWEPTKGRLLGNAGAGDVNFADQDGIYILHNGNEVAYVGQSYTPTTETAGLYSRLRNHHNDKRKSDRWESFSWFGFRPVNEDGQLLPAEGSATTKEVINLVEGILIEGLMPRLNMRRGEGSKAWEPNLYNHVEDPLITLKRLQALADLGLSRS